MVSFAKQQQMAGYEVWPAAFEPNAINAVLNAGRISKKVALCYILVLKAAAKRIAIRPMAYTGTLEAGPAPCRLALMDVSAWICDTAEIVGYAISVAVAAPIEVSDQHVSVVADPGVVLAVTEHRLGANGLAAFAALA